MSPGFGTDEWMTGERSENEYYDNTTLKILAQPAYVRRDKL